MVNYKKEGNYVIYELADEIIADFLTSFHALSEKQLVEVQQIKQEFLNDKLGMEGVTLSELKERMEKGEVLLLDVRPAEEYEKLIYWVLFLFQFKNWKINFLLYRLIVKWLHIAEDLTV